MATGTVAFLPPSNENGDCVTDMSAQYFLPSALVLRGLGLSEVDLDRKTATVNTDFLRRILRELASYQPFDPDYYAKRYPDIEGARLAGRITSMSAHFIDTGYLEGRVPCDLPFDAVWYYEHYKDLARSYEAGDVEGLRRHFVTTGYLEGRAGTASTLDAAERWRVD